MWFRLLQTREVCTGCLQRKVLMLTGLELGPRPRLSPILLERSINHVLGTRMRLTHLEIRVADRHLIQASP